MVSAQRKALEGMWKDRCSVYVQEKVTGEATKLTGFAEKLLLKDQPCKLSFETLTAAQGDGTASVSQATKLFLSPGITIPAGSKIVVTRPGGAVLTYQNSGEPGLFTSHQEIRLELFRRWA